jgi:pectin methylesterase-like acyl-CoA thioesterase
VKPSAHLLLFGLLCATAHGELKLVQQWPTGNSVCADTPLRLTFDRPPTLTHRGRIEISRAVDGKPAVTVDLGAEKATDHFGDSEANAALIYEPLWIDGNTVQIRLPAKSLQPGVAYQVRVSPGVFQDGEGHDFAGISTAWTFRTKALPSHNVDRLVVAGDGTGDFCTVQGAVDQVNPHRDRPTTIFIRRGRYHELVRIGRDRTRIHLLGEDRQRTVISYTNNDKFNPGWIQRCVLGCEANDFLLENLTVQNTTPYKGSQAEAVFINGERCILRKANFLSFQDTLNLSGRVYVADSYIEGDVDYVWGYGTACFERCELRTMHDGYIVQARNSAPKAGYVFLNCRLTAAPEVKKCWLARIDADRFPDSQVAFIHCAMGAHILPEGWQITGTPGETLRFEESDNTDLEGKPVDITKRSPAAKSLAPKEAASRSIAATLSGSDGWSPNEDQPKQNR